MEALADFRPTTLTFWPVVAATSGTERYLSLKCRKIPILQASKLHLERLCDDAETQTRGLDVRFQPASPEFRALQTLREATAAHVAAKYKLHYRLDSRPDVVRLVYDAGELATWRKAAKGCVRASSGDFEAAVRATAAAIVVVRFCGVAITEARAGGLVGSEEWTLDRIILGTGSGAPVPLRRWRDRQDAAPLPKPALVRSTAVPPLEAPLEAPPAPRGAAPLVFEETDDYADYAYNLCDTAAATPPTSPCPTVSSAATEPAPPEPTVVTPERRPPPPGLAPPPRRRAPRRDHDDPLQPPTRRADDDGYDISLILGDAPAL